VKVFLNGIRIVILRRGFAFPFDDARVVALRRLFSYLEQSNRMLPLVAEVEKIKKSTPWSQSQGILIPYSEEASQILLLI
jgi:hypothetical protein